MRVYFKPSPRPQWPWLKKLIEGADGPIGGWIADFVALAAIFGLFCALVWAIGRH